MMYQVTLQGQAGSFFTDIDPSLPPPTGKGHYWNVKVADFRDSYVPETGWQEKREGDARRALESGCTRSARIHWQAVAMSQRCGA